MHQSRDLSLTKTTLAIYYTLRCALTISRFFFFLPRLCFYLPEAFVIMSRLLS